MLARLLLLMFAYCCPAYCCPAYCMQPNSSPRIETHRNSDGIYHYSVYHPAEVRTSIEAETYTVTRTLRQTNEGKIEESFNGTVELNRGYNEAIYVKTAAKLFTAFTQKYKLIEKTPEEWLKELKQKP